VNFVVFVTFVFDVVEMCNLCKNMSFVHDPDELVEHIVKPEASHSYRITRLKSENEKLKSSLICKCCHTVRVETLTLPCAHIVCCEKCADVATNCPLCNDRILGTVRIYMA